MNRRSFFRRLASAALGAAAACYAPSALREVKPILAKPQSDWEVFLIGTPESMSRARDMIERMQRDFTATWFYGG